jgi:hypothetical protein
MYKNVTRRHPQHTICAGVSSVTKDAGTARCAVVSLSVGRWCSQGGGGSVFSFFVGVPDFRFQDSLL